VCVCVCVLVGKLDGNFVPFLFCLLLDGYNVCVCVDFS